MAVNTGVTLSRYLDFVVNGHRLSGDMRRLNGFGTTNGEDDVTGWLDDTKQYIAAPAESTFDIEAIFSNEKAATGPVEAGAHTALVGANEVIASMFIGIRKRPEAGNPGGGGAFTQTRYEVNGQQGPVMVTAGYKSSSGDNVWGDVLAAGQALSSTTNGASVDNGAATTGGYIAILHVSQTAGAMASNDWAFKVQHSTDNSAWSDLVSFTADGAAITAEKKSGGGTVNRYTRLVSTKTAGTARPWVILIRK